jgi:hypothetical protein
MQPSFPVVSISCHNCRRQYLSNEAHHCQPNAALVAIVAAQNRINTEAARLAPLFLSAFAPLIGKKVTTAQDTLTKLAEKVIPAVSNAAPEHQGGFHMWRNRSEYTLSFTVRCFQIAAQGPGFYREAVIRVGEIDGGTLTKVYTPEESAHHYVTNYDAQAIQSKRNLAQAAQEIQRAIESSLYPFIKA